MRSGGSAVPNGASSGRAGGTEGTEKDPSDASRRDSLVLAMDCASKYVLPAADERRLTVDSAIRSYSKTARCTSGKLRVSGPCAVQPAPADPTALDVSLMSAERVQPKRVVLYFRYCKLTEV
eukprot:scaffold4779_cov116-Isochrysis_galbana.AAC.13